MAGEHPREGELRERAAFRRRDRLETANDIEIPGEVLFVEARMIVRRSPASMSVVFGNAR
jgi:hypothetical protein